MEMEFREAGHFSQLLQFHLAIQIPSKMVDDPINSFCVFAVGLGLLAWHGFYCVLEISLLPEIVLVTVSSNEAQDILI